MPTTSPSIKLIKASNGSGNASAATVQTIRSSGATTIIVNTVQNIPTNFYATMGAPHTFVDPVTSETITVISAATAVDFEGRVDGSNLEIDAIAPGYVDTRGSLVGDIIIIRPTTPYANNIATVMGVAHDDDGKLKAAAPMTGGETLATLVPTGSIFPTALRVAPANWLLAFGQAVSRTTYAALFNAIASNLGTFTVTIAAPAVVTKTAHGLLTGDQVYLTTTGALPTGLTANTLYYVIYVDANSFRLATSRANALVPTPITTTGSQSGVHTLRDCPYGLGDGSTTFTLPDLRGRILAGADGMGGTAAARLTNPSTTAGGVYGNLGAAGGEQAHIQSITELVQHNHLINGAVAHTNGSTYPGVTDDNSQPRTPSTANTGSSVAANVVQPTAVVSYIIKT